MNDEARMTNGRIARWAAIVVVAVVSVACVNCEREARVGEPPPRPLAAIAKPPERIRIEAEDAERLEGGVFRVIDDEGASGGRCLEIPIGAGWPGHGTSGSALYRFHVRKAGLYTFWRRQRWPTSPCNDAVGLRFDRAGSPRDLRSEWRFDGTAGQGQLWAWGPVFRQGKPRAFFLSSGEHCLEILNVDTGVRLDVILLANDPDYVPTGMLGAAALSPRERARTRAGDHRLE